MNLPAQAEWVKAWLAREKGVERFAAVNTHWHPDHVAGNWLFERDEIVFAKQGVHDLVLRSGFRRGSWPGAATASTERTAYAQAVSVRTKNAATAPWCLRM